MMQNYNTAPPRKGMVASAMPPEKPEPKAAPAKGPQQKTQPQDEPTERVVLAAMKIMYEEKSSDGVVGMLRSGEPAQALAGTALFVLKTLNGKAGGRIPPPALVSASSSIVDLLAELAQAAKVQLADEQVEQAKTLVAQRLQGKAGQPAQQQAPAQQPTAPIEAEA